MLKIKKLNPKGFGHHFLMAIIVLLIGVGGAYTLVKSHADDVTSTAAGGPVGCVAHTFTISDEFVTADQPCVKYAQVMLNYEITSGALNKEDSSIALLAVDGEYGPLTQAAVVAFQKLSNTPDGADGMLGQYTWAELCYYLGQAAPSGGPSDTTLTYRNGFVGAECIYANPTQVGSIHWVSGSQTSGSVTTPSRDGLSGSGSGGSATASKKPSTGGGSGGSATASKKPSTGGGSGGSATASKKPPKTKSTKTPVVYKPGCYVFTGSPIKPEKVDCYPGSIDQLGNPLNTSLNCYLALDGPYAKGQKHQYDAVSCRDLNKTITPIKAKHFELLHPSTYVDPLF